MSLRLVHVVAGLDPSDGGPSHTLPPLLHQLPFFPRTQLEAFTTTDDTQQRPGTPAPYILHEFPRDISARMKWSKSFRPSLEAALKVSDLCHNHGCWLHPNWTAGFLCRKLRKPLIISPLGHLDDWSLSRHPFRKKIIRFLFEQKNWKYASAFVAKSEAEAGELQKVGITKRIQVIPNGIQIPVLRKERSTNFFLKTFPELQSKRILLFLSRIHPKKGLADLLLIWNKIFKQCPDWHLVIAGNVHSTNQHGIQLQEWTKKHPCSEATTWVSALTGEVKEAALGAASLFILPSHSENFGQVILEALASATPVLTTKGCPWPGIESYQCGKWVENQPPAIESSLLQLTSQSESELATMGLKGRNWIQKDFGLDQIARRLHSFYHEILSDG